jgi:hypothetical protein
MIYYSYGTAILTAREAKQNQVRARAHKMLEGLRGGRKLAPLDLPTGSLSTEMVTATTPITRGRAIDWQPIGVGKPLTIEIREVYTGEYPSSAFGSQKPMLLASATKSIAAFDAKPLALNYLTRKTAKRSRINRPGANQQGTPVIFHSPAMTDLSITVGLSMVFDEFPKQFFDSVGSAFKSAAGIPVFLTTSMYLLAASEVTRIAAAVGEMLFDGKPAFEASEAIDLALPGAAAAIAGFMLITPGNVDTLDAGLRRDYQIENGRLVNREGEPYQGDAPYVILAVDGSPRPDLADFAPTAVTAAALTQFYGLKDGDRAALGPLVDALKLYSDMTFRTEVDRIDARLGKVKDQTEKAALEQRREALLKNIASDLLRP